FLLMLERVDRLEWLAVRPRHRGRWRLTRFGGALLGLRCGGLGMLGMLGNCGRKGAGLACRASYDSGLLGMPSWLVPSSHAGRQRAATDRSDEHEPQRFRAHCTGRHGSGGFRRGRGVGIGQLEPMNTTGRSDVGRDHAYGGLELRPRLLCGAWWTVDSRGVEQHTLELLVRIDRNHGIPFDRSVARSLLVMAANASRARRSRELAVPTGIASSSAIWRTSSSSSSYSTSTVRSSRGIWFRTSSSSRRA